MNVQMCKCEYPSDLTTVAGILALSAQQFSSGILASHHVLVRPGTSWLEARRMTCMYHSAYIAMTLHWLIISVVTMQSPCY